MKKLAYLSLLLAGTVIAVPALAASSSVEQRLERLERRVSRITDLTLEVEALKQENRRLRGEIESQQHAMETLKRKQRDLYLDVDQRISNLQSQPGPVIPTPSAPASPVSAAPVAAAPATVASTPAAKPASTADPANEEADYKAAYAMLSPEQKRYQAAIKAFRVFLHNYPASHLAANAQYWLAEASYVSQDNKTAQVEFQKVVDNYPDSLKVPGALLKIGYIQHAAGDIKAAQATMDRVIKEHPDSSAAGMAKQRLERIRRENP